MITYKFNEKKGIVETLMEGEISVKDLTEYILKISGDNSLPVKLKILTDARKGKFSGKADIDDLKKIVEANYKSIAAREIIYDAFVISGTVETALGLLYQELSKADNYFFNVFSTKKAAEEWLNNVCK